MIQRLIKPLVQLALMLVVGCMWLSGARAQEFAPSAYPDRVILTWSADPATTQTVTWRTDVSVTEAKAQVRLEEGTPDLETGAAEYPAESRPFVGKEGREDRYHHVAFTGLQPAKVYAYRVGDGTHWSEWSQFRTAATSAEPFSFIYLGDAQNDIKSKWSRAIRQAFRQQPNARSSSPVYVLSVAGPKMYKSDSERWMDVSLVDTQLYQILHVAGGKLQYQAYDVSGKLVDSFELTK